MTPTRLPSLRSIALLDAMAADPTAPASLRRFHAQRAAELRAIRQRASDRHMAGPKVARTSPFSRFADALENGG